MTAWSVAGFTAAFAAGWQLALAGGPGSTSGWIAAAEALGVLGAGAGLAWLAALALVRRDPRRDVVAALFACAGLLAVDAYSWGGSGGDVGFDVHSWQRGVAGLEAALLLAAVAMCVRRGSSRAFRGVVLLELTVFLLANAGYAVRDGLDVRALGGYSASPRPIFAVALGLALRLALLQAGAATRTAAARSARAWYALPPAVLLLAALTGCDQAERPPHPLDGEWEMRIEAMPTAEYAAWNGRLRAGEVRRARGVMVFHPEIARYPKDEWFPEQVVGRGYVDFGTLFADTSGMAGALFGDDPSADRDEQVIARIDSAGRVEMVPIPLLIGNDPYLRGTLRDDTVRGEYIHLSHSDTLLTGSFVMWRVPRSDFTDSARVRSERGLRAWLDPADEPLPEGVIEESAFPDPDFAGDPLPEPGATGEMGVETLQVVLPETVERPARGGLQGSASTDIAP